MTIQERRASFIVTRLGLYVFETQVFASSRDRYIQQDKNDRARPDHNFSMCVPSSWHRADCRAHCVAPATESADAP